MDLEGKNGFYAVGNLVAKNDRYRLRMCVDEDGRELMLQAASSYDQNINVQKNLTLINRLSQLAVDTEASWTKQGGEGSLNYELGFPEIVDNLILKDQGFRMVNIIGIRNVDELGKVFPALRIWKDGLAIDLPSSAWIFGKLMKTISFMMTHRVYNQAINGNNVLLDPDQHYVVLFDWSKAWIRPGKVPKSEVRNMTKSAANLTLKLIGDIERYDNCETDRRYIVFLQNVARNGTADATKTHSEFYTMVDDLCSTPSSGWVSGFHEFTTFARN